MHGTHHPVSTTLTFEEQREVAVESAARFREHRMVLYLRWLASALAAGGGRYMVGGALSAVDLSAFQILEGLAYAFPRASERLGAGFAGLRDLQERVRSQPRIAAYLASPRRLGFNETGLFRRYPELDG